MYAIYHLIHNVVKTRSSVIVWSQSIIKLANWEWVMTVKKNSAYWRTLVNKLIRLPWNNSTKLQIPIMLSLFFLSFLADRWSAAVEKNCFNVNITKMFKFTTMYRIEFKVFFNCASIWKMNLISSGTGTSGLAEHLLRMLICVKLLYLHHSFTSCSISVMLRFLICGILCV